MDRFDKKTMTIYSDEYERLIKKEIEVWSQYQSTENFEERKKTHAYKTYRKGTVELELRHIEEISKDNISVLELGSADGWLSNQILSLKNVKEIYSIDISLEENRKKYKDGNIAIRGDLNKINQIQFNKKFDCIITHGTLHHLVDPKYVLEYCIDNLLAIDGLLIVNDTWVLRPLQLKINALFYTILNRLPHSILEADILEVARILFVRIPRIIMDSKFAGSIAHSHKTSPFESISSADDYKDIYSRNDMQILYFENKAALPGLQNSWMRSPDFIKNFIQKIDNFLIKTKILPGDLHICIMRKVK